MKNIFIKLSDFSPEVNFNFRTGHCILEGESYPEDAIAFYQPVMNWLTEYFETEKKPIIFDLKITYFNTSSSKRINDILKLLRSYQLNNGDVTVNWYYNQSDVDMEEEIEDYEVGTKITINKLHL